MTTGDRVTVLSDLVPPGFPDATTSNPLQKLFAQPGTVKVYYPIRSWLKLDSQNVTVTEGTGHSISGTAWLLDYEYQPVAGTIEIIENRTVISTQEYRTGRLRVEVPDNLSVGDHQLQVRFTPSVKAGTLHEPIADTQTTNDITVRVEPAPTPAEVAAERADEPGDA